MGILYVGAGVNHFINPDFYKPIMPAYLPAPLFLIYLSGAAEILAGIGVLFEPTRRMGAWLTIAILLAVFPANIQMAIDYGRTQHPGFILSLLRLPIQFLLIYWAWTLTKTSKSKK